MPHLLEKKASIGKSESVKCEKLAEFVKTHYDIVIETDTDTKIGSLEVNIILLLVNLATSSLGSMT